MNYRSEVIADSSGQWCPNHLIFATYDEASGYVRNLAWRWTSVEATRVVETDEPVTHRWTSSGLEEVAPESTSTESPS